MRYVVGMDVGTAKLWAALVPLRPFDEPAEPLFRGFDIEGDFRRVGPAVRAAFAPVTRLDLSRSGALEVAVEAVAVELPAGPPLTMVGPNQIFGAVMATIPEVVVERQSYYPAQWRRKLALLAHPELRGRKTVPKAFLDKRMTGGFVEALLGSDPSRNEHFRDALGIALVLRVEIEEAEARGALGAAS